MGIKKTTHSGRDLKDKAPQWPDPELEKLREENARLLGTVARQKDIIMQLKDTAARVQADPSKFAIKAEHISDGFFFCDRKWRCLYVNDKACRIMRRKREEVIGKVGWEICSQTRHLKFNPEFHRALKENAPVHFEEFYPAPLNIWLECHVYPTPEGLAVFLQDITERKKAEAELIASRESLRKLAEDISRTNEELIESRKRYFDLVEKVDDIIFETAADGRIVYVSRHVRNTLGYEQSELEGRKPSELFETGKAAEKKDKLLQIMKNEGRIQSMEVSLVRKDGNKVIMETNASPFFNAEGELLGYRGVTRDITARKKAEEELRRTHQQLISTLESITDGFVSVDRQWRFNYVNESAARIFHIPRGQVTGKTLCDLMPGSEGFRNFQNMIMAMDQSKPVHFEEFIPSMGIWLEIHGYPSPEGLSIYFQDITERKRAEEALLQSEKRFRFVSEAAHAVVYDLDLKSGVIRGAHGVKELLGRDDPETPGLRWWLDLIHPDDLERVAREMREVYATKEQSHTFEYRVRHSNGEYRLVRDLVYFQCDESGQIVEHIGGVTDITEQRRAEDALRESEEKYRAIFENSMEGIFVTHSDGNILSANPEACRLLERSEKEIRRIGRQGFMDEKDPRLIKALRLRIEDGVFRGELTFMRSHMKPFPVEVSSRVFRDRDGVLKNITVFRDITKRKRNEEKLREITAEARQRAREAEQRKKQLEQINHELESFSYSISHDLRYPLRAVHQFTEIILKEHAEGLDSQGLKFFNLILKNTKVMEDLIQGLLSLSRVSRQEANTSKLNVNRIVKDILQRWDLDKSGRKTVFKFESFPPVMGDQVLLRQVFANLISNSLKFTRRRRRPVVAIGGYRQDGSIVYYVRDNGIGFKMSDYGRLFGTFQRLHSESQYEGSGIGLALVQRIIHKLGGQVWAKSRSNKGAAFYFSLPDAAS